MFHEIHETLRQLLYSRGRIGVDAVDVAFETPTAQWLDSRTRPTISLYLCDLHENVEKRHSGRMPHTVQADGKAHWRMAPRFFDLCYLVSAIADSAEDEHFLLSRTSVTLLRYAELPQDLLADSLQRLELPVSTRMLQAGEGTEALSVWNGFGVPPRPALSYVVTLPVDLDYELSAPRVSTVFNRFVSLVHPSATAPSPEPESRHAIGGVVLDASGRPLSDITVIVKSERAAPPDEEESSEASEAQTADPPDRHPHPWDCTDNSGRFILSGVTVGTITLTLKREGFEPRDVPITVPSPAYTIVWQ